MLPTGVKFHEYTHGLARNARNEVTVSPRTHGRNPLCDSPARQMQLRPSYIPQHYACNARKSLL